jgi:hypothetical protein
MDTHTDTDTDTDTGTHTGAHIHTHDDESDGQHIDSPAFMAHTNLHAGMDRCIPITHRESLELRNMFYRL